MLIKILVTLQVVGEAVLSHRNEDVVLEQENMLDNLRREAGSSCIETSEDETAKTCTIPTPEENVPGNIYIFGYLFFFTETC